MKYITHKQRERARGVRTWFEIRHWESVCKGKNVERWELWRMTEIWRWWWPLPRERWELISTNLTERYATDAMRQLTTGHYKSKTRYTEGGERSQGGWA